MNSSNELNKYLGYFRNLPLDDFEDHLEAEYFSKEILEKFYKLDWHKVSIDKLNLFQYQFAHLQEVIIKFIYGEFSENDFCKMARENKRNRVNKLKNDINFFIEKKKD